jgi:cyclopropane fatty-acyl-phospholipid synthase-like methyltransferase
MTDANIDPMHADLDFNSPLSDARVEQILTSLEPLSGALVVDLGCGWAELLLRVLATEPTATGVGVDQDGAAIEHGRANALARGLADRVELQVGDAAAWSEGPADVVLCVGASHVFGGEPAEHTATALKALRSLLRPGGRLVFGECFWQRPPTEAAAASFSGDPNEYRSLAELVDLAHEHGYRMLALSQATTDEWDAFQSGYLLGWERWLLANPGHPDADDIRKRADDSRTRWLHDWRDVLGFAYLTLVVPA